MPMFEAIVQNPVKVSVGVLLVALFGGISMVTMPKQLTPEVENPVLTIETRWSGASPQEIEREIVQEQEEQLKSVQGLSKMSSECMDSRGRITLEFLVGTVAGGPFLRVGSRAKAGRPVKYLKFLELGTVKMQPYAFVGPTFEHKRDAAINAIQREIMRPMDRN